MEAHARRSAQMTSFDAKRAGDLANANMKAMGIDWVTFEGKQIDYHPAEPGEHFTVSRKRRGRRSIKTRRSRKCCWPRAIWS